MIRNVLMLLFGFVAIAAAQDGTAPKSDFTCTAGAGTPVIVRAEGITELVGDVQPVPRHWLYRCTSTDRRPVPAGMSWRTSWRPRPPKTYDRRFGASPHMSEAEVVKNFAAALEKACFQTC
jgi:hypothetical protein